MPDTPESKLSIVRMTAVALAVAVAILVTTILPAEYGIDPLGTGRVLGLTQISGAARTAPVVPVVAAAEGPLVPHSTDYKADTTEFAILPYVGFVEYHYHLDKGTAMVYSWTATGNVVVDFHAQQDGGPPDVAETFEKGEMNAGRGVYTAPYTGLHGWYWENRTNQVVRIKLSSVGFYTSATEFRDDGSSASHELRTVPAGSP
ncbi:MAG: hypothetical protein ABL993_02925 [Vicinamibacterales bacterium]